MRESRGMGAIAPSKVPKAVRRGDSDAVPCMAKGDWIQEAVKSPGSLKKSLGVPAGETIPAKRLAAAAKKPGKMGQRARLAQTLKGFK